MDFTAFVLSQLPRPPARVLELGCGDEGGLVPVLADAGYDVLGIDPRAPEGPRFRLVELAELEEDATFDAAVASRVLHHLEPLDAGVAKLARLAPLLLVDEFAPERIDAAADDWYAAQFRALAAAGLEPDAPPNLGTWRATHPGLHPSAAVRAGLGASFAERHFEWRPYLYRWLRGPTTEALEEGLISAGAIPAIGYRYAGVASGTARSARAPR